MTDIQLQGPIPEAANVSEGDPTRILFLDIDGVINSTRTYMAFGGRSRSLDEVGKFDWVAIGLLQRLCLSDYRLKIVLSSTWRLDNEPAAVAKAFDLPIIDKTPGNDYDNTRGEEIKMWLDAHPTIRHYVIVDDNNWMLPEQQKRFVKTDSDFGLSVGTVKKIIRILQMSERDFSDVNMERVPYSLPGTYTVARSKDATLPPQAPGYNG